MASAAASLLLRSAGVRCSGLFLALSRSSACRPASSKTAHGGSTARTASGRNPNPIRLYSLKGHIKILRRRIIRL
uniref:Uncharacterized protein n=1 Tax=Oryza meridionalis TaxID=40149 RepID=A0A0E0EQA6_9ORYZ